LARDEVEAVEDRTIEVMPLQTDKDDIKGDGPSSTKMQSEDSSSGAETPIDAEPSPKKKGPRKLVEEESRAVGRIGRSVWETYIKACGGNPYWLIFAVLLLFAAASPVAENGWLRYAHQPAQWYQIKRAFRSYWSGASQSGRVPRNPMFYIRIYAAVSIPDPRVYLISFTCPQITGVGSFKCYKCPHDH